MNAQGAARSGQSCLPDQENSLEKLAPLWGSFFQVENMSKKARKIPAFLQLVLFKEAS
jgi:hypothetical protein